MTDLINSTNGTLNNAMPDNDALSVDVGALNFASPLMAASGTCGFGRELNAFGTLSALGAFVTKTITEEPRAGNPPPRICETRAGLLNSIGLANPGYAAFRDEILPAIAQLDCPCIFNIGGKTDQEYITLAERLADSPVPKALELNLSCPNVTAGGIDYSRNPAKLAAVTRAVKKVWSRPLWVKLTPNVADITEIVAAAAESGADAAVVANTYLGMAINWRTRRSMLGRPMAGLSGPAIMPITLRLTWQAASTGRLPIIACGGITCADDVLAYFVAGASAVQLGSQILRDPQSPQRITREIQTLLAEEGIPRITDLTGTFKP